MLTKNSLICLMSLITLTVAAQDTITTIFAHGLGANGGFAYRYNKPELPIIITPIHTFNFPHSLENGDKDYTKVSLAQEIEIETLKTECAKVPGPKILYGRSMGASSIITYVCSHHPENIKALILEAPFDTVYSALAHRLYQQYSWGKIPGVAPVCHLLLNTRWGFPAYNPRGISPLSIIANFDLHIPVLFVHSRLDSITSLEGTQRLVNKLRQAGHKQIYCLILDHGKHGAYIHEQDARKYLVTAHAFYRTCGLPHDASLADEGTLYLAECQL